MEAPSPITPKPELKEEMKDVKEFKINFLDNNYQIKLGKLSKSQKIGIIIEQTDNLKNYLFKSEFSLEELKQLSKLFRIFDSIDEAFNDINDIKIKKVELDEIDINLILSSLTSKTENICLKIKKKSLTYEKINEIIFKELNEIKSVLKEEKLKNDNLKKIVDELVKENEELKNQVKELIDWKNDQLKKNENIIDGNNFKELIDSKIIKTKEEIELLSKRLTPKGFLKNSKVIFNLLYRASRDGDSPYDYHNKCDGKTNTLCVIQTTKGCKFGGYSEVIIDCNLGNFKDKNAFVFSLNKNKIYEILNPEKNAGDHCKGWGPIFRSDAFAVWNKNFFSYDRHTVGTRSESNYGAMNEDYEINNGEKNFGIKELEVFQIIID